MNSVSGGEGISSDPIWYASLQSTVRHYLSGYLHQFLVTYGDGLLPLALPLESLWQVLNIPCCSGDWLCDIAYQNPLIELVGIDPDPRRITFAQAQAAAQGITNATFLVGDMEALAPPDQRYDLLHVRFLAPLVRQEAWGRVTAGWWHLCRPGGLVAWTEMNIPVTNSAAFAEWCRFLTEAVEADNTTAIIAPCMAELLQSAGFQHVHRELTTIDISSNTRLHKHICLHLWDVLNFVHSTLFFSHTRTPFARLHELYEHMIRDILSEGFQGSWTFETYMATREA